MPQSNIMQRDFGRIDTCAALQSAYDAAGWPKGADPATLRDIDRRLKTGVTLIPDRGQDTWTPLARTVIAGTRKPAADCDDVAVTGAQLAVCAGFPAERLGLLVTRIATRRNELHVVAFYTDPETGVWVFGDTMGKPRALSNLGQTVHFFTFIDNITNWWALRDPRTGKPLTGSLATSSIPDLQAPDPQAPAPQSSPDEATCKNPHF